MKTIRQKIEAFSNSPRFVFFLVGSVFSIVGLSFLLIGAPLFAREYNLVEETVLSTPAQLETAAPNQTVLLEGNLSEINPSLFESFVTYARYEYYKDAEGDGSWRELARFTPPLQVDAYNEAGGRRVRVQIVNETYYFNAVPHEYRPEEAVYEGAISYRGFKRGDRVLVLGSVVRVAAVSQGQLSNGIDAAWIYGGSRSDYLGEQQIGFWIFGGLGAVFSVVGLFSVGLGLRKTGWG
jgi:hypothetical protein